MIAVQLRVTSVCHRDNYEVYIDLDAEGLVLLRDRITQMIGSTSVDHVHLMSEAWAGNELESTPIRADTDVVHHLCIVLRKETAEVEE